jgi:hypothetical protein
MKHMQHTSETHKTYRCNMCSSTCCTIMEARSRGARHRHRARGRPRSTGRWIASGWIVAWREHEARAKVRDARRRAGVSVPSFARGTRSGARDTRLDVPVLSFGTRHEDTQRKVRAQTHRLVKYPSYMGQIQRAEEVRRTSSKLRIIPENNLSQNNGPCSERNSRQQ